MSDSKKYPELKNLDYAKIGEEILAFWKENQIFEKSVSTREGNATFTFYEGPPSANGTPGIHHVMARAVKDIFCRYKTMQGFQVKRKGGWDTHGLPVELQVEKELGITKEDIGKKISIEDYNQKCKEAVMKYTAQWNDLTEKMGYWVDLENPYITYEPDYIESLWFLLKRLYDKQLLYEGYTIQPYSPAAGTGLSSHELNQPGTYKNVKDTSMVAQFKMKPTGHALEAELAAKARFPVYFLAWTTTPWTLPANSALVVGESIQYTLVETYNPYTFEGVALILAKDLLGKYFTDKQLEADFKAYQPGYKLIPARILGELSGKQLVGLQYEQLLPYVQPEKPAFRVIPGDFVTTEDGTGIVHCSPTFGADDFRAAQQNNIPAILVPDETGKMVPIVDRQGKFVKEIADFAGMYVKNYNNADESAADYKSTDVLISIKLKTENKAFKVEKYEHSYPHCWRTDKPVLYYPLDSWFIRTTAFKDDLVALNKTINWKPASTGLGRFGNWLENLVDWNLSRSRYWGTPLPIWKTEDGQEETCIGSVAELANLAKQAIDSGALNAEQVAGNEAFLEAARNKTDLDLHRPHVDNIFLISATGQVMTRVTDLIDVWFDSGAMPYAQWHWPFENHDTFSESFPADFIAEGVDQTRGWFFTLHAISTMLFGDVAFKNVIANGLVLDKNGNKMSKRLGNAIDPFDTIAKFGPDPTRWYMISNAPPWENLKFNLDGVQEVQRKFFGTLANTYSFFALYANLDGFNYQEAEIPLAERTEADRWILSKLNTLVKVVTAAYDDYDPTRATRAIQDFVVDDLSNWYVRLNRKRFWKGEPGKDKNAAYQTLYTCLATSVKLTAPVAPFFAETIFKALNEVANLENAESVHLAKFPLANESAIDAALEQRMDMAQKIASLVHSLRKKHTLKVRQPLSRMIVPVLDTKSKKQIEAVADLILSEVNIKKLELLDDASGLLVKKARPNFKKLGKSLGEKMKFLTDAVKAMSQEQIQAYEQNGSISLILGGDSVSLQTEDLEILTEDIPGWVVASENGLTVALDLALTDELKQEGIARDMVNRLQNLRKDMGLDVQAKINIEVERVNDSLVEAALASNKEYICTETQALDLRLSDKLDQSTEVDMDDFVLKVNITEV